MNVVSFKKKNPKNKCGLAYMGIADTQVAMMPWLLAKCVQTDYSVMCELQ